MTQHTPGPWEWKQPYEYAGYHELVNEAGTRVMSDGSAYGEYSADIDVSGDDARLIAAAPDLLAACKAAFDALQNPDEITKGQWADLLNGMWAAIAKAEGGAA